MMEPITSPFWIAFVEAMRGEHVDLVERLALYCAMALFLVMAIGMIVAWQVG